MERSEVREMILRELPALLEEDAELQRLILRFSTRHFAGRAETESRFDRVLDELRRDREEQTRKWEENQHAQEHKWEAQDLKWAEERQAQERRWEAQERKWEENQRVIEGMLASVQRVERRHDSTIGALGARWGLHAEGSFRNALKGILEESFGVEVIAVNEWDDAGEVFGRPDQVELDLIIRNGLLILCEIKSSVSKAELYAFDRKTRFYEKRHGRAANRRIVISPMVDRRAGPVAQTLGIEVYSYAEDVPVGPETEA